MSSPEYRLPRMHVGILTYQTGHLKTWQITRSLLTKGYRITLFAFPFKLRPSQLQKNNRFKDRPDQLIDFDMDRSVSNMASNIFPCLAGTMNIPTFSGR